MVTYAHNKPTETRQTHSVLIGTPLVLVLVFAFSFVLMHPAKSGGETAAASRPTSNAHKTPGLTATTLAPLPLAQTTLPTLTPAPASGDNGSGDNSADSTATASPQATGSSSASSPKVQSAIPNTSASNPGASINIRHSSPHSLLRGLLKVL